jgi:hypothetical protein
MLLLFIDTAGTCAQLAEFGFPHPGRKPRPDQPDKTESLKTCFVNLYRNKMAGHVNYVSERNA